MTRCWACRRDVPDEQSYCMFIRERWGRHKTVLGIVICMDCRSLVSNTLGDMRLRTES